MKPKNKPTETNKSMLHIKNAYPTWLEGVTLNQPLQATYIGITLDKQFTFGPYLKNTVKKCGHRTDSCWS